MEKKAKKRTIQGKVVSNKMMKTVVVLIETTQTHPRFHKITKKSRRVKVHDELGQCQEGDLVLAEETRPLSKDKRHNLIKIIERAK
jgi:small subunit ribosomal protein S17